MEPLDINNLPNFEELKNLTDEQLSEFIYPDDEVLPFAEVAALQPNKTDTFPTGLPLLNEYLEGGFRGGDLVVIAGRSGEGKTSLAQTMTYHMTKKAIPALWFSYEVSVQRLHEKFVDMGISDHYYVYAPKKNRSGNLEWVEKKIVEAVKKYWTKVVFIDHIDMLSPRNIQKSDNESQVLKKIATELKQLAITLDVVIVLMAHVRKTESRKKLEMQDISSSAGIYQLSDFVILIER